MKDAPATVNLAAVMAGKRFSSRLRADPLLTPTGMARLPGEGVQESAVGVVFLARRHASWRGPPNPKHEGQPAMSPTAVEALMCSQASGGLPHSGQAAYPIRAMKWRQET